MAWSYATERHFAYGKHLWNKAQIVCFACLKLACSVMNARYCLSYVKQDTRQKLRAFLRIACNAGESGRGTNQRIENAFRMHQWCSLWEMSLQGILWCFQFLSDEFFYDSSCLIVAFNSHSMLQNLH